MKILHVIHNYHPAKGGPQYTVKQLGEKLVSVYNDEVQVFTSDSLYGPEMQLYCRATPSLESIAGVSVQRFPLVRWHYPIIDFSNRIYKRILGHPLPQNLLKKRWGMDSPLLHKAMMHQDADVIMASTINYNFCDYPFWHQHTNTPKPFVVYGSLHMHINWPQQAEVIKRARACDCYIANTNFERDKLINNYGLSHAKIITIGTGIEPAEYHCSVEKVRDKRKQLSLNSEDIVLGYIGRLSEGKGVQILIDAFQKIEHLFPTAKLLLAGTKTACSTALKNTCSKNSRIIIIEDFADHEKKELFNVIDIFVNASKGESFGVVFLEAWSCRKPVIGADAKAVAEVIADGKDGFLFETNNTDDLAEKMKMLMQNANLCSQMGESGFLKIKAKYNWSSIVAQYRNAYKIGIENFNQAQMDSKHL